jgi:hypothetical protein
MILRGNTDWMTILENAKLKRDKIYHVVVYKGRIKIKRVKNIKTEIMEKFTYHAGRWGDIYIMGVIYCSFEVNKPK